MAEQAYEIKQGRYLGFELAEDPLDLGKGKGFFRGDDSFEAEGAGPQSLSLQRGVVGGQAVFLRGGALLL
jgi:hypothetical protein